MAIKIIVLDFDGVVVESNDIKNMAFSEMFIGSTEYEQIMCYHRMNNHVCRQDKFRHILGNILKESFQEADITELSKDFSELTREKIINCPLVKGAEDFIKYFSSKFPLYIASATPSDELRLIIEARKLSGYFKRIYGAPDVKAKIFADIIKAEAICPKDLLFIGDSKEDYDVADDLGLKFIGKMNGDKFQGIKLDGFKDLFKMKSFILTKHIKGS